MKHIGFFARAAALGAIVAMALGSINLVLKPKHFFESAWPTTVSQLGFYEMEKGTVDVLFLGSSICVSAFSPQEIYNEYGIRSNNYGSEQQSIVTSYYRLKEALQVQTPRAVVLETSNCFRMYSDEALNASEPFIRMTLDFMKASPVKSEYIRQLEEIDPEQSAMSHYFTNLRYHTRWRSLSENDFLLSELRGHNETKGYGVSGKKWGRDDYTTPVSGDGSGAPRDMVPLAEEYLNRMISLCSERGIEFILVSGVNSGANEEKHRAVSDFAQEHGVRFIDFNVKEMYDSIGFVYAEDTIEGLHANYLGAQKMSREIGRVLSEEYGLQPVVDEQYESTRAAYDGMIDNAKLETESDLAAYLRLLDPARHTIFIAVKDDAAGALGEDASLALHELGLGGPTRYQNSYCAVISENGVFELEGEAMLTDRGTFRKGRTYYEVCSAGHRCGLMCSIRIGGVEYAKNLCGLNIVVYDRALNKIVDSVCFDTSLPEQTAYR